jgi:putative flippase GtrA
MLTLQKPGHRYVAIGVSVYAFELIVILLAQHLGASAVVAVGVSYWFGLVISFSLHKLITFRDKRLHHRILVPQVLAYSLLVLFNFGFTLLVARLLRSLLPAVVIRTVALGLTTIWNYYLYKTHIFKTDIESGIY